MTDERLAGALQAFTDHENFERIENGEFEATKTPFGGEVHITLDDGKILTHVIARVPMLDEVVVGETVADVVEEGWFETLEMRLADTHKVTSVETTSPKISHTERTVAVEVTFRDADPSRVPEEAQAVIDYVVGTWMEGVIPGYEYTEEVEALRNRASQNYDDQNQGADLSL